MKRLTHECKIAKIRIQFFKKILKLSLVFLFVGEYLDFSALQQKFTITGKVTDATSGEAVIGASIVEKGTTNGTMTDASGAYTLSVSSANATLTISFVGYESQEIQVSGKKEIDISLSLTTTGIKEVVVTALGIQRTSRSLSYAQQQIDGNQLTTAKDENMINSLEGKTAGLSISKGSSGVGGSSKVVIRGNKSFAGYNEPLYVIDGLPMNNTNLGQLGGAQLSGTVDGGDAISNLNPEDIESISVLKGASASALYGSAGENGVILITTKKGAEGKTTFEVTSSTTFDNALLLPKLQGNYGRAASDPLVTGTTPAAYQNDPLTWSTVSAPGSAITTSDLGKFYQTGIQTINGISLQTGNDKNTYFFSYANTSSTGIVPMNSLQKNNVFFKETAKVTKDITVDASATIVAQDVFNRPFAGQYYNPALEAEMYPGSESAWGQLKNNYKYFNASRAIYLQNYPYCNSNYSGSYILDNPYWTVNKDPNDNKRFRTIFTLGLNWNLSDELSIKARGNLDRIDYQFQQDVYAGTSSVITDYGGMYWYTSSYSNSLYNDVLINYNNAKKAKDFTIDATLGFSNSYYYSYAENIQSVENNNNFIITNVFSLSNMKNVFDHTQALTETLNQSIFLMANAGYKNTYFLDLTGRNEWNSTIPNQSYFYPSIGASVVLSELTGTNDVLSFAKARVSYSQVGNGLAYGENNTWSNQFWSVTNGSLASTTTGIAVNNGVPSYLKPERSESFEAGLNVRLLKNSIDFDITYYDNNIINQQLTVLAPAGANEQNYYVNAGQISNKGVEITLNYKYAPKEGLHYSTGFNFAYNLNRIVTVDPGVEDQFVVTPFSSTKIGQIMIVKGGSYGDLYTYPLVKQSNGNWVGSDGTVSANNQAVTKVGNPNPPVTWGWSNTLAYKGFTLNFLIDAKIGGTMLSTTEQTLDANGRSARSGSARDANSVTFMGTTVTGEANIANFYQSLASASGYAYAYNATNIRLREISLGYDIPVQWSKSVLKKLNVSVFGKNLFFFYNAAPFDPEVSAGTAAGLQGIEAYNVPSTSSYGFSLKATF